MQMFHIQMAQEKEQGSEEFPLNYPKAVEVRIRSGKTKVEIKENTSNISADLLKFEKKVLQAKDKAFLKEAHAVDMAKKHLRGAFKQSKGMEFTEAAKHYILNSGELTSKQLKGLSELAKRESSKDFQLSISKSLNGYNVRINPIEGGHPSHYSSGPTLAKVLPDLEDFSIEKFESSYAKRIELEIAESQKAEILKALTDSDAYKNKFDEQTLKSLEPLSQAYNLNFPRFKDVVENTPKIKLNLSERDIIGDRLLKVSHEDYPKAGYMPLLSGGSTREQLLARVTASTINDFAQTTLKSAHEEAVKVDAVQKEMANFFAQARANKK